MRDEHLSQGPMILYIADKLTDIERSEIELHMEACEHCLQMFMTELEASETEEQGAASGDTGLSQVMLPDMNLMEKRIVSLLLGEQQQDEAVEPILSTARQEKRPKLRSWLQHPVAHYTIAASITLLLLFSGTFSSFSQRLAQFDMDENAQQATKPQPNTGKDNHSESWSNRLVDQTGTWLDGLKAARFK
ncbi:zf-HC2 domain-containing protein [Paenibacillus sinopodophylli]|uniref:zf-HC2 domain-containing protein n=1 Tax=Paenibacillus sinopodophylli TaxID=1837342 RepID=UPI00110CE29D|nr:zf-HC2 domain-containing protein [Paenibacillus sinopodophylli]